MPDEGQGGDLRGAGVSHSPLDLIPDFTPFAGYGDDALALGTALLLVQMYITDEIKAQAWEKIRSLFGKEILRKLDEEGA